MTKLNAASDPAHLVVATLAPSASLLALTMLAIGFCTTAPQVLLPFAADLAAPAQRGRVIGAMQTGLVLGTLFSRVAGGFIGSHFGWRAVFGFAAVVMLLSTFAVARVLPARPPHATLRKRELWLSVLSYVGRFPRLRISMLLGGLAFATFAGVWTVFAFHLHDLGYGSDVVGSIGLLSLITAFAASWFGVLADRLGTLRTGTAAWVLLLIAFGWVLAMAPALFWLGRVERRECRA